MERHGIYRNGIVLVEDVGAGEPLAVSELLDFSVLEILESASFR